MNNNGHEITGSYKTNLGKEYIGQWYFPIEDPGHAPDIIATIKEVRDEVEVFNPNTKKTEKKRVMHFVEDIPALVLNRTNQFALERRFNTDIVEKWKNQKIAIYYDPTIKVGGKAVGGVRVRDVAPVDAAYYCADCGQEITAHGDFDAVLIAERAKSIWGCYLCFDCANKRKEKDGNED